MSNAIYSIVHVASGREYIGGTSNPDLRWRQHRSRLNLSQHQNPKLQAAWLEYGERAFEFSIIGYAEERDDLLAAEQYAFDQRRPFFNMSRLAGHERLGSVHSEEAKEKMSAAHSGKALSAEHKAKLSAAFQGRQFSVETRAKLAKSKVGVKRAPFSAETRAKMSASAKNRMAKK